jgi:lysophospholipase L1-like esterase
VRAVARRAAVARRVAAPLCAWVALLAVPVGCAHAQDAVAVARGGTDDDVARGLEAFEENGALGAFHAALGRAERGAGRARVVLYGDSHTAGSAFQGALRARLQARFGDGGPGFVLPVPPFPHYRAPGCVVQSGGDWRALRVTARVRTPDRRGLAGVVLAAPGEGAWGELRVPRTAADSAWTLELWADAQPGGGTLRVLVDDEAPREVSLAAAAPEARYVPLPLAGHGPHRLRIEALRDGKLRVFGAVLERAGSGVVLDALGLNGARAADQLLWDDALFREHLARRRPDLVMLAYGTNEAGELAPIAAYEASLRAVVARARAAAPGASCALVGPTDRPQRSGRDGWAERPRQAEILEVQRRVARSSGCAFFDTVRFQGGPLATHAWASQAPPLAQRDHVHLTHAGYRRLADALYAALVAGLPVQPGRAGR